MSIRTIIRLHAASRDDIADLVTRRPLPNPRLPQLDPFLFLNHHGPQTYRPGNRGLPFGPHPHRGFETVTFILDGSLAHSDTGGHESIIEAGGVQWMTAGAGLIHAELSPAAFKRDGGAMEILQLWVNLPGQLKMVPPRYTGVQRDQLPVVTLDDGRAALTLIAGGLGEQEGPIASLTGLFMSVVTISRGGTVMLPAPRGRAVFLYVVAGNVRTSGTPVAPWHLVELGDGETLQIEAVEDARLLFGHGDPIGEPVVAHGPFVMNSQDEIVQAYRDYQAGLFERPIAESV